jgi:hypothetical protein
MDSLENALPSEEFKWLSVVYDLPESFTKFGLNGLLKTLPSADNKKLWKMQISSICKRCGAANQTIGYILGQCCLNDPLKCRVKFRHNSILRKLIPALEQNLPDEYSIFADLPGSDYYYDLFPPEFCTPTSQIPDLIISSNVDNVIFIA